MPVCEFVDVTMTVPSGLFTVKLPEVVTATPADELLSVMVCVPLERAEVSTGILKLYVHSFPAAELGQLGAWSPAFVWVKEKLVGEPLSIV